MNTLTGTIESIAYRGAGILRPAEGPVVFVHGGVCAGERVTARITRTHARFAEAEIVAVETPAPERIPPVCRLPDGTRVPGCVYDHMDYSAEVATKQEQLAGFLRNAFRKAGREDLNVSAAKTMETPPSERGVAAQPPGGAFRATPEADSGEAAASSLLLPPTPSPLPLHYRNKIVLHAGRANGVRALGYLGDDNRTLVDIPQCPLAHPEINRELADLRADRSFQRAVRNGDDVTLRYTEADGVVPWIGRPSPRARPLTERAFFGPLEVPLDGFYQVNPAVADLLASDLADEASALAPSAVIDAYCGIGILGLAILSRAPAEARPRLLGMETGRAAVVSARRNASRLGINAEYAYCSVAEGLDAALDETGPDGTLVVLDPPRDGLESAVVDTLLAKRPAELAYVSCSPDRLARDLERLCSADGGYTPRFIRLFDMFPRTHHFETLVLLGR